MKKDLLKIKKDIIMLGLSIGILSNNMDVEAEENSIETMTVVNNSESNIYTNMYDMYNEENKLEPYNKDGIKVIVGYVYKDEDKLKILRTNNEEYSTIYEKIINEELELIGYLVSGTFDIRDVTLVKENDILKEIHMSEEIVNGYEGFYSVDDVRTLNIKTYIRK